MHKEEFDLFQGMTLTSILKLPRTTLKVNMMVESETSPQTYFNAKCGNKYSFVSKEDKKVMFLRLYIINENNKKLQKNIICTIIR